MPIQGIRLIPDMMIRLAEWQLEVSLTELRRAVDLLLNHLEAVADGDTVRLDEDYFWSIPQDALYDVNRTPAELTVGQLSWSWQHLTDLLADPDQAIGNHLVWLAEVLRAIGQKVRRPVEFREVQGVGGFGKRSAVEQVRTATRSREFSHR